MFLQSLASEADAGENGNILNSAEAILHNMVRDALLALQLLPDNASAGILSTYSKAGIIFTYIQFISGPIAYFCM